MLERTLRHWDVLKESWSLDSERRTRAKRFEEEDFLPAALEVLEKPPAPLGRGLIWGVVLFLAIALLWSVLGHVDVVASAPGKLIPRERVKVIQPAEIGVVRAIHVHDGMRVAAGDVLIELDPSVSGAEEEQARRALMAAKLDRARARSLLNELRGGDTAFLPPLGVPQSITDVQQRLVTSQIEEFRAQLATLEGQRAERRADLAVVEQEIAKLSETLPLLEEQMAARRTLMEKGLSPRLLYLEMSERRVAMEKDLEIQLQQRAKMQAALAATKKQIEQLRSEFAKTATAALAEAEDEISIGSEELKKAASRSGLQRLVAPVDGIVQQLAVHTLGGVVQPAEPLMIVVPGEGELVADVRVFNKDVGFVEQGDRVEVKLEAFPFTKFGVVEGELENLSSDAIEDETLGLIYQARIRLLDDSIEVDGRDVPLAPGMAVTAEIKTGTRRIIEFLLSPLLRYKQESLRER